MLRALLSYVVNQVALPHVEVRAARRGDEVLQYVHAGLAEVVRNDMRLVPALRIRGRQGLGRHTVEERRLPVLRLLAGIANQARRRVDLLSVGHRLDRREILVPHLCRVARHLARVGVARLGLFAQPLYLLAAFTWRSAGYRPPLAALGAELNLDDVPLLAFEPAERHKAVVLAVGANGVEKVLAVAIARREQLGALHLVRRSLVPLEVLEHGFLPRVLRGLQPVAHAALVDVFAARRQLPHVQVDRRCALVFDAHLRWRIRANAIRLVVG
mmetsp:Transcript_16155/g.52117  ORF Transcript_16155/g.52117 Transcript_16155/m.52117 type:complete len:271 (-) Transcript_16155:250-1062(-)